MPMLVELTAVEASEAQNPSERGALAGADGES